MTKVLHKYWLCFKGPIKKVILGGHKYDIKIIIQLSY